MSKPRVLLPLDGSERARAVLPAVARLVDPERFDLKILRVVDAGSGLGGAQAEPLDIGRGQSMTFGADILDAAAGLSGERPPPAWPRLRRALEDELAPTVAELKEMGFGVFLTLRFGEPAREILALAETEPVALVAMTTHGRTGLLEAMMGSVAAAVLHEAPVPVLLVRPDVVDLPTGARKP